MINTVSSGDHQPTVKTESEVGVYSKHRPEEAKSTRAHELSVGFWFLH